jgi:hypothetical protein
MRIAKIERKLVFCLDLRGNDSAEIFVGVETLDNGDSWEHAMTLQKNTHQE